LPSVLTVLPAPFTELVRLIYFGAPLDCVVSVILMAATSVLMCMAAGYIHAKGGEA
jgi:hypothetical protein